MALFTESSLYHLVHVLSFTYQIVSDTQGALDGVKLVPSIHLLQLFLHDLPLIFSKIFFIKDTSAILLYKISLQLLINLAKRKFSFY